MDIESYRNYCLSLGDDVTEKMPFQAFKAANGVLAFYVCGHLFSYFDTNQFRIVNLKCQPDRIEDLKTLHSEIGKPHNLSDKHWIGVDATQSEATLLRDLTRNSYNIVKQKYGRRKPSPKHPSKQ